MKPPLYLLAMLVLNACSTGQPVTPIPYMEGRHISSESSGALQTQKFVSLFQHLKAPDLAGRVDNVYADPLYFNDTLVTLHNRSKLTHYLQNTADNLDSIDFQLLNITGQNREYYVHWQMRTCFQVWGSKKDITTYGISHLQFDESGLITLHQDYWDNTEGFFQHLPIIGGVLAWIKDNLHD